MNGGVIDQAASPDEIYKAPRTAFAADFIGAANLLPAERVGDLARLRGSTVAVPVQGPAGPGIGKIMLRPEAVYLSAAVDASAPLPVNVVTQVYRGADVVSVVDARSEEHTSARQLLQ